MTAGLICIVANDWRRAPLDAREVVDGVRTPAPCYRPRVSNDLHDARYINLETFRKDGSAVRTPVWLASLDGKLVVGTDGTTHKVKRIRNNPKVRVAVCNASGKKILGEWRDGTARLIDGADAERAEALLAKKYGWQQTMIRFFGRLSGRMKDRVIIEIVVDAKR